LLQALLLGLFHPIVVSLRREPFLSFHPMTSFLCCIVWLLALLVLPFLIIDWATMSQPERIRRLYAMGYSQRKIASQLSISRHRVKKALA
jgi:hypothetical protein